MDQVTRSTQSSQPRSQTKQSSETNVSLSQMPLQEEVCWVFLFGNNIKLRWKKFFEKGHASLKVLFCSWSESWGWPKGNWDKFLAWRAPVMSKEEFLYRSKENFETPSCALSLAYFLGKLKRLKFWKKKFSPPYEHERLSDFPKT